MLTDEQKSGHLYHTLLQAGATQIKFQGQKSTLLLFYIMISAHNMGFYSSDDKYMYNHKLIGFNEITCFKYLNKASFFLCSFLHL